MSEQIIEALDRYRDIRDQATEALFLNFYGSPAVQALAGLRADLTTPRPSIGRDVAREATEAASLAALESRIEQGGRLEAGLRALIYIGLGRPDVTVDERVFATLRQLRQSQPESYRVSLSRFKEIVREQYLLLRRDEERALAAIPRLMPDSAAERAAIFDAVRTAAEAAGDMPEEVKRRLARVASLFKDGAVAPVLPEDRTGGSGIANPIVAASDPVSRSTSVGDSSEVSIPQIGLKQPRQPRRGDAD